MLLQYVPLKFSPSQSPKTQVLALLMNLSFPSPQRHAKSVVWQLAASAPFSKHGMAHFGSCWTRSGSDVSLDWAVTAAAKKESAMVLNCIVLVCWFDCWCFMFVVCCCAVQQFFPSSLLPIVLCLLLVYSPSCNLFV